MNSLEKSLLKIAKVLKKNKIPYMVIGGIANLFWGVPRTTLDIDITIQISEDSYITFIEKIGRNFKIRTNDPFHFIMKTNVLPVEDKNGIRIDLIFAKLPYELKAIRRSKQVRVCGKLISLCSPEDLIIHKIISDRPRDQEDIRGIISSTKGKLNRRYLDPIVREMAEELSKPEVLKFYYSCFTKVNRLASVLRRAKQGKLFSHRKVFGHSQLNR